MKRIKYIATGFFCIFLLSGCLDDFKELNTNPELLGTTDPRSIFTGAVENWNNRSRSDLTNKYSDVMQYMQYLVFYEGADEGTYVNPSGSTRPLPATCYYNEYYENVGLKLNYLIHTVLANHEEKERYKDLEAISRILETYEAWLMFDIFGAAPYTEAFKLASDGIRTPRYDLYQKDINGKELYKVFDETVKAQVAVLSGSSNQYELGNYDYFFKGDISKWIKFGNTLRIKMAQRLEKADNAFYTSTIQDALSNAGGIITSLDQSCIYNHPNEHNNNTDDMHILTYQYCASRAFVNFLLKNDDPRLPLLVRRNGFGLGNNNTTNDEWAETMMKNYPNYEELFPQFTIRYVGMSANPDSSSADWSSYSYYTLPYIDEGTLKNMTIRHNSQIESRFYVKNGGKVGTQVTTRDKEDDSKYNVSENSITLFTPLITYPETCFMMAEIALKAGSAMGGKDANTWFREGIRASMQQYQAWAEKMMVPSAMNDASDNYNPITDAKIDAYLAKPEFATATLEKIISQQWVNLFMRPEEAWATWKRTGLPAFKDQPEPVDGVAYLETLTTGSDRLLIPRRAFLSAPNAENMENYNIALDELEKDPNYGGDVANVEGRIWWDKP